MLFNSLLVTSSNRAIISLVYFLAFQFTKYFADRTNPVLGLLDPPAIDFLAPDLFNPLAICFFASVSLIFGARFLAAGTVPSDLLTVGLFYLIYLIHLQPVFLTCSKHTLLTLNYFSLLYLSSVF